MHTYFPEWYRTVALSPSQEQLEKRWQAVEQVVSSFDSKAMLDVVRLMQPDLFSFSRTEEFVTAFQAADPLFPMRDNAVELQVLATSVIIDAMSKGPSEKNDKIALATVCSCYARRRKQALIPEVLDAVGSYLKSEGQRVRVYSAARQQQYQQLSSVAPKKIKDATDKLAESVDSASVTALNNIVVAEINELKANLNTVLAGIVQNQNRINANQKILNEETEILWWIMGEWSRDLDQPFQSLSLPLICIVAAKELADLTTLLPHAPSAKHLLDKVLKMRREKKVADTSLLQAVNAVPRAWRETITADYSPTLTGNVCPVLLALEKSLQTDGDDDWVPAFKKAANLDPSLPIDALSLAVQTHMECLLARAIS